MTQDRGSSEPWARLYRGASLVALIFAIAGIGGIYGLASLMRGCGGPQAQPPPRLDLEARVRFEGWNTFVDTSTVSPGSQMQVVITLRNRGAGAATGVALQGRLATRDLRVIPGSCQLRSSSHPRLRGCPDNISPRGLRAGGLTYESFGPGAWVQAFFNVAVSKEAAPHSILKIIAFANANETANKYDQVLLEAVRGSE